MIRDFFARPSVNRILSITLLVSIALTGAEIIHATAPDPGHNFTDVDGGVVLGDILYGSGIDALSALAGNITTTKKFLRETGNGSSATVPAWDTLVATDIPDISATYSAKAGNTSLVTVGTLTTGALGSGFTVVADAQISSATAWNGKMTDPMTTIGDIIIRNASNITARLAGAAGFLKGGVSTAPTWSTINLAASADVGTSILPVANGGTNLAASVSDAVLVGDSTSAYTARALPASCAGTTAKLLYDSTTNLFSCGTDQTGAAGTATQYNQSVAQQLPAVTDTYLIGSSIAIPASSLKIGTRYHMIFNVSKTAAGLATPILNIRFGTLGTTGDAAKCTLTWTAQTAAIDAGTFEVWTTFRTVGSGTTAVLQCTGQRRHGASVTGLGTLVSETKIVTSAGFDSTVANSIIGSSITSGTSAVWTIQQVQAELSNLQ